MRDKKVVVSSIAPAPAAVVIAKERSKTSPRQRPLRVQPKERLIVTERLHALNSRAALTFPVPLLRFDHTPFSEYALPRKPRSQWHRLDAEEPVPRKCPDRSLR